MKDFWNMIQLLISALGGWLGYFLGGCDGLLYALLAFAVIDSIVKKVCSQAGQLHADGAAVCLTGGLCSMEYIRSSLSKALGTTVMSCEDGRYAGAIGAALSAEAVRKASGR